MSLKVHNFIVHLIAIGVIGTWAENLIMHKSHDVEDAYLSRVIRDIENGSGTDETDHILQKNTDIHVFANDSNPSISMVWSGSQGVILALTTSKYSSSRLYRSVNNGRSFTDISSHINHDRILGSHGILVSPVDSEHVLLVKDVITYIQSDALYVSRDSGKTFDRSQLKFNIKQGSITFNPKNSLKLLAVSVRNSQLYLSYDFGLVWKHVSDYVSQVKWDPLELNTFYYTKDPSGKMISGGFSNELYKCSCATANIQCSKIAEHIFSFGIQGGFLFISVEYLIHNGSRVMHVSKDGGLSWDAAQIPMINKKQFYSILDMSEDMVFVHVDNVEGKGDGTIYTSGDKGVIYSKSLTNHLYPNMGSITDFYKVSSLKGVYITSQLSHPEDTIHSMITFDKGGTWQKIDAPKGSVCAKTEKECQLQMHNLFSKTKGVSLPEYPKSRENAVGIILAHANIGDALNLNTPDVYVSNDGGYTWLQPKELKGPHYYSIGDSGGLLYAVTSSQRSNKIKYSTDEGETWAEYTFLDHPIKVTGLSVEPGSRSTILGLWGWDEKGDGNWRSVTVDFKDIMQPCKKDDYVKWKAHESNSLYSDEDNCLLGKNEVFMRKKKGSRCQNGKNFVNTAEINSCKCFKTDYMCDYGYQRNLQDCIRDETIQDSHLDICIDGKEEMIKTQGYRKIPGDKCEGGFAPTSDVTSLQKSCVQAEEKKDDFGVDKTHFTEYVPVDNAVSQNSSPHTNVGLVVFLVLVILGLGATLVFILRKRNFSRQRVKYVPLSTSEHATNDGTVGNSTYLFDDGGGTSNGGHYSGTQDTSHDYASGRGQTNVESSGISYHDDSDEDMLIS